MHAKFISVAPLPAQFEWVIVSRWGTAGEHLALGWTMQPALTDDPPTYLVPRRTSLARAADPDEAGIHSNFALASSPDGIALVGDFVPAKGHVRLFGKGLDVQMVSKGKSLRPDLHPSWQFQAVRKPWFGEFVESGDAIRSGHRETRRADRTSE